MSAPASVNPEQLAAIEADGAVFVSAGAGTGKTTVLVERYVRALRERGLSVDAILVITYTERAAGELRERIRARLVELGERILARDLDRAWISTIHGFCSRLLRSHPFEAGLDPRFRVLDEAQSRVLRAEAFRATLAEFVADRRPERVRLLATYGSRGLATMLVSAHERLRSAGRPLELTPGAVPELGQRIADGRAAARQLLDDGDAALVHPLAGEVDRLLAGDPKPDGLLDLSDLVGQLRGSGEERLESLTAALRAIEQAALDEVAARDRSMLQDLLVDFDLGYRWAKERESAVDFEDLQLLARDLLRRNERVLERTRFRFRSIMVDEFQDTNRLQCELIDLVGDDDLFFVGDEFQSIYRFRHADVDVFRERRARSGGVVALTRNYRSRPEVLEVVNHLFAAEFGEAFQPLEAAARFPDPAFEPAVELLITDKRACRERGLHWRSSEALHVARRIRSLVDSGEYAPGDVVLLFAAGTSADAFERALRARGLPTYRATGRGYFGQQQVVDLLAYLRLLHNRYDDEALVTVLASPLVGVSNDALVLLRQAAGRRPLFSGLERQPPAFLSGNDRRLFEAFRQRYERLSVAAPQLGLERLCERVMAEHDYDLAVLARWDGRRRYANIRKLARLARSYEELRGPDLEGFVRFVRDQEAAGAREVEAVAEEEGADAVRLLTIHAAKGLQFRVVVVCDTGRAGRGFGSRDEILCLPDGRFGFRVADPVTGKRRPALGYEELRDLERASADAESMRLFYVAMTRAVDRLILSGSIDPGRRDASRSPIGWVVDRLGAGLDTDVPVELDVDGARVVLRLDRGEQEVETRAAPVPEQLALFTPSDQPPGEPTFELRPLASVPEPSGHRVRRLSYSALALYERCSYRFYVERLVGLSGGERTPRNGDGGLEATEIGDAVHVLLERATSPSAVREGLRDLYPEALEEDAARIESLVAAWIESELGRRVAALADAQVEFPFAFVHDGVLLHGRFDLFHREGDRALVLDYKTNRLAGRRPVDVVEEEYRLQRLVYAIAALRAGVERVEVAYVFLEMPDAPTSTTYGRTDLAALERALSEVIDAIQLGNFRPTPGELVCDGCPALDRVCAGPRLDVGGPWAGLNASAQP